MHEDAFSNLPLAASSCPDMGTRPVDRIQYQPDARSTTLNLERKTSQHFAVHDLTESVWRLVCYLSDNKSVVFVPVVML